MLQRCLFGLMLLIVAGCGGSDKRNAAQGAGAPTTPETITLSREQIKMMGIELAPVTLREVAGGFTANGKVAVLPQNKAAVTAKIAGRLEEIMVHEGQDVRKGQPLFRLATTALLDIQQSYLHARGDLIFLEKELERQRTLQSGNAGAAKNLEEVQSRYFRAKSDLQSAEAKLNYLGLSVDGLQNPDQLHLSSSLTVLAPIAGNVTEIPISLGQSVSENAALCHIVNAMEHLHGHIEIFAQDAGAVAIGNSVIIRFPGGQRPELHSKVEYISREVNPDTRTVSLHVPLPDGKGIIPGMPLVALLEQTPVHAAALPESAVLKEGESSFGFALEKEEGDQLIFRKVVFGPTTVAEGFVSLGTAATPGTQFAVKGAFILASELKKGEMKE